MSEQTWRSPTEHLGVSEGVVYESADWLTVTVTDRETVAVLAPGLVTLPAELAEQLLTAAGWERVENE